MGLSVLVLMLVLRRWKPGLLGCSPQDRSVHEVYEFTSISIPNISFKCKYYAIISLQVGCFRIMQLNAFVNVKSH